MIREEDSKRITALRFLLAFGVVVIHNCFRSAPEIFGKEAVFNQNLFGKWIQLLFSQGIFRCGVPLFFLFASFLQAKKGDSYAILLKKRAKSLLLPYFIWLCIYFVYPHLIKLLLIFLRPSLINHPETSVLNWHISDWFHFVFGYGALDAHGDIGLPLFALQFWFVRDLMILILISPAINFAIRRFPRGYFLLTAFLLFCPVKNLIVIRTQSLFFYSLGLYWAIYEFSLFEKIDEVSWLEAILFFALTFFVTWLFYDKLDTSYWFMNIAAGILLLKFSKNIAEKERSFALAKFLAPYSFFLYAIHIFLLSIIRPLWVFAFPMKNAFFCLFEYFGATILTVFLSLAIGIALKKICPPLFRILNGGR